MKILYINHVRLPTEKAHGIQIMEMCQAFANLGVELELIVPRRFNNIKEDPFSYYDISPNFKITYLPCIDLIPLDYVFGRLSYLITTFSFILSAKIYSWFKKYDLIYSCTPFVSFFFKKTTLEIHSLPKKITLVHKYFWGKAHRLVVLTNIMKKELVAAGIPEDKILVAADGVNLEKFVIDVSQKEAREKLNLPANKKIAMYTGSFFLHSWKGVDNILQATSKLPNHLFVLVGGTKKEIDKLSKEVVDNVLLIKKQQHSQIPLYLKAADILLLPNTKEKAISEKYTSPLKLFEYMASKRSIIASNLPSIKEVLNEKNSLLVEPTIQGLVSGINQISQNKEWADKISAQALVDVQNYSWLKRAQKIIYEITNKQSNLNKKSLFVRIIKKINKPRRYKNLNQTIDQLKPKNIMEIGVWNGNRSLQMITAAQKYHSPEKINYYGFDLFEDLTLEKFKEEVSKMPPLKQEVEDKLRMTKSNINLFKGDTIQSLPENIAKLPKMDFIFIDGGHSLKTITNDWYCVQQLMHNETVVIFDDYWNRNDAGAKPIIEGIDKERFGVEILKPQDKFKKEWGILKINFVKVKRKTL